MANRQAVKNPDLWGWQSDHVVETEALTPRGAQRSVQAVYLDGERVGYLVSRADSRGRREWDYTTRDATKVEERYGLTYASPSRQHAAVFLVEHVLRERAAR